MIPDNIVSLIYSNRMFTKCTMEIIGSYQEGLEYT